jgi:hypothetical protein
MCVDCSFQLYHKGKEMKMLPAKYAKIAQSHVEAIIYREFIAMLNPKYRGPAFRWDLFPNTVLRTCDVSLFNSFPLNAYEKWETEIRAVGHNHAQMVVKKIMEESGILEWWPETP